MILAPCRCLDCDPQPIQARLFSHALVENDLGDCADCGRPATGGRDLANEERARWGQPPIHAQSCASLACCTATPAARERSAARLVRRAVDGP
jgi:hypothetical protein